MTIRFNVLVKSAPFCACTFASMNFLSTIHFSARFIITLPGVVEADVLDAARLDVDADGAGGGSTSCRFASPSWSRCMSSNIAVTEG